jgi:hypothetical protein
VPEGFQLDALEGWKVALRLEMTYEAVFLAPKCKPSSSLSSLEAM